MGYRGKINLEEEAPDHPLVTGSILFVPKPPVAGNNTSDNLKDSDKQPEGDVKMRTEKEILEGIERAGAERDAEWEAVKKKYPINPNDPPEKQAAMKAAQDVAMLDP